jgi:hypothetical protein
VPFQGVIRLVPTSSQGVALGWILAAFQAEIASSGGNPGAIAVTYPPEFSQLLSTPPSLIDRSVTDPGWKRKSPCLGEARGVRFLVPSALVSAAGGTHKANQALAIESLEGLPDSARFRIGGALRQWPFNGFRRGLHVVRIEADVHFIAIIVADVHDTALLQKTFVKKWLCEYKEGRRCPLTFWTGQVTKRKNERQRKSEK